MPHLTAGLRKLKLSKKKRVEIIQHFGIPVHDRVEQAHIVKIVGAGPPQRGVLDSENQKKASIQSHHLDEASPDLPVLIWH